jgi:Transcription antiterminator
MISEPLHWYAIYVRSRAEKKVFAALEDMGVEAFLPLITKTKKWSDRLKKIEEPLFKSYIFVRPLMKDYYNVLNIFGVLKFVSFERKPVVVPDNQIVAIKKYISDYDESFSADEVELHEGQLVRITSGQLAGLTGRLSSIKNKKRLVVFIETVGQYLPIDIARSKVEPVYETL